MLCVKCMLPQISSFSNELVFLIYERLWCSMMQYERLMICCIVGPSKEEGVLSYSPMVWCFHPSLATVHQWNFLLATTHLRNWVSPTSFMNQSSDWLSWTTKQRGTLQSPCVQQHISWRCSHLWVHTSVSSPVLAALSPSGAVWKLGWLDWKGFLFAGCRPAEAMEVSMLLLTSARPTGRGWNSWSSLTAGKNSELASTPHTAPASSVSASHEDAQFAKNRRHQPASELAPLF